MTTTATFTSTSSYSGSPGWADRSGQQVEVVRSLDFADTVDLFDTGPMYAIRFADGIEASAYADELDPEPTMERYAWQLGIADGLNTPSGDLTTGMTWDGDCYERPFVGDANEAYDRGVNLGQMLARCLIHLHPGVEVS